LVPFCKTHNPFGILRDLKRERCGDYPRRHSVFVPVATETPYGLAWGKASALSGKQIKRTQCLGFETFVHVARRAVFVLSKSLLDGHHRSTTAEFVTDRQASAKSYNKMMRKGENNFTCNVESWSFRASRISNLGVL
jgi:hypothetical protein